MLRPKLVLQGATLQNQTDGMRGKELSLDDIDHYQKIIKILVETDKIMHQIDAQ